MVEDRASSILADLLAGNERFSSGRAAGPRRGTADRLLCVSAQSPKAAVLSCSDSRVPPEILFDQGLGDLFVVRTAGHVVDRGALGSLEYAVGHLHVPVVIVLGHSGCGAVTAAVAGTAACGNAEWVMDAIRPAAAATSSAAGNCVDRVARAHVTRCAAQLTSGSSTLRDAVTAQRVAIVEAFYDLGSGRVEFT